MIPILMMEDEQMHTIMHAAQLQHGSLHLRSILGYVASYDPSSHMVKCIVPAFVDMMSGDMKLSGWIPLLTPIASNGWGIQYAPFGGATTANPALGEQVYLNVLSTEQGAYIVSGMTWNVKSAVPMPTIQAGEIVVRDAKGNQVYLKNDGSINVTGQSVVNINGPTQVNVTSAKVVINGSSEVDVSSAKVVITGSAGVDISGTSAVNISSASSVSISASSAVSLAAPWVTMGASGQQLNALVTSAMVSLFNGHTHITPNGTSSPPLQLMGAAQLTTTVMGG